MAVTQKTKPVVKFAAQGDTWTGAHQVNYLHWVSKGATGGDDLLVLDSDGDVLWEDVADGANYSKEHPIQNAVNGIDVSVMDSGTLYLVKMPKNTFITS